MFQPDSKGKIFLAGERGCSEQHTFRSHHTFNFGAYAQEHKAPFGALCVLNDDTLAGEQAISMQIEANTILLLLPVVGAITITDASNDPEYIEAGQCRLLTVRKSTTLTIRNPFHEDLVNFLQLWIRQPAASADTAPLIAFEIDTQKNQLISLSETPYLYIGKFSGRAELEYRLQDPRNGVFAFVIDGAFEVQCRLLHARDGLALWDTHSVELEALSNDAIILLAEIPL